MLKNCILAAGAFAWSLAGAQTFPPDAPVPTAAEISAFVKDKTLYATRSDGVNVRFNYQGDGKFEVKFPRTREFGTWRAEDGQLCVEDPMNGKACNQVRIVDGKLLYRRNSNGEVLTAKE